MFSKLYIIILLYIKEYTYAYKQSLDMLWMNLQVQKH